MIGDSVFTEEEYERRRREMVERQIAGRDVTDRNVLDAMRAVPRHRFIPEQRRSDAYVDAPVAIGRQQTISQPYIVASMTEHLQLQPRDRVLEIGTGCGYQTAVLAEIAGDVYSIERIAELADQARENLQQLGYHNVSLKIGDGGLGWPEHAPFDAIIITAAAPRMPETLIDQLALGGRMVLPMMTSYGQQLVRLTRRESGIEEEYLYAVRFVPMLEDTE
ncbi:protein-L-isoaspartate(D-aspartate) O-methyltransferase [candidate division GN15 bacterium]|nr:protein-L-isoaspartate(D-aspartate) O-methyltransferase [candidate division GN15 bacterium]